MRLTLVISSLSAGGAERVITTLANAWVERNWQISILTLDDESAKPFYQLDGRIKHQALMLSQASQNVFAGMQNNLRRIRVLRRALSANQPDVIVSFMATTNIRTLIAAQGLRVPVIISERINPAFAIQSLLWKAARKIVYPWASIIIAQTEREAQSYNQSLRSRVKVIPNPISPLLSIEEKLVRPHEKKIIAVGRLERQKGFDLLLSAFAKLKQKHPEWTLTIFGEGSQRESLEQLSRELGIQERVLFPWRAVEITREFAQASLFVLPSRYEGFPNALCEAMACGLPVIAADCPYGPREIIRHGLDGVLVANESVEELATAMDNLMADQVERERLSSRALEITSRFSLSKIIKLWDDAFASVSSSYKKADVACFDLPQH